MSQPKKLLGTCMAQVWDEDLRTTKRCNQPAYWRRHYWLLCAEHHTGARHLSSLCSLVSEAVKEEVAA